MATKKTDDAFDFSSGDYVKQYEEKAKKFAQDAQTEASYTIDEAKETVNKMKEARNDSMKLEVDFDKYIEFVDGMTSSATKDVDAWV